MANPSVQNERIFAVPGPVSMNAIIQILRKHFSQKKWDDFPDYREDLSTFEAIPRAEQLLKEAYNRNFQTLEESVMGNAKALVG